MRPYLPLSVAVVPSAFMAMLAMGEPADPPQALPVQQSDTVWLDEPRPYLGQDALQQLRDIWSNDKTAGACLIGSIEEMNGRRSVRIDVATAAAFPERCTGFTRYVGAGTFLREAEGDAEDLRQRAPTAACSLLQGHPDWAESAGIFGFTQHLVSQEGRIVEQATDLDAWFCTWQQSSNDRQTAVRVDSIPGS